MGFNPITTQEQLDSLLAAEREKFKGYVSPDELKKQTDALSAQITELTAKNKAFELSSLKAKIAREAGLRPELAERLTGEDEKSLKADAKALAAVVTPEKPADPLPLRSSEDGGSAAKNAADAALYSLLDGLND